jgi:small conductance mechanosensitive channel
MPEIADFLSRLYADPDLPGVAVRIATVLVAAWLVSRVLGRLVPRLVFALGPRKWRESFRPMRLVTLRGLIAGAASIFSFVVALVIILSMFFEPSTVLTVVGLFSAAFGLGARPLIADVLSGVLLLFEDQFAVGEKVELSGLMGSGGVMGSIERVGVRTTHLRADSGELFIVPNGDVRVVRNFTRGEFSLASVTVSVRAERVPEALAVLKDVAGRAHREFEDIVEEPMVISESGVLAAETAFTLKVKTRLGRGADVRAELLARIQRELVERGVHGVAA